MPDLTSNLVRTFRSRHFGLALLTTDGEEFYVGAAVGLNVSTGRVVALSDVADANAHVRFVGIAEQRVTGSGTNTVAVRADGPVLERESVTAAAGADDVGRLVYMTSDNAFTLTRPAADAVPVGIFSRHRAGTTGDVLLFTLGESIAFDAAKPKQQVALGTVGLPEMAADDVVAKTKLFGRGKLVGFHCYTAQKAPGSADGDATFELHINGTAVAGVSLALDVSSSGVGEFVATSATGTVNVRYRDGDEVAVKCASLATAFDSPCATTFYVDVVPA